MNASELLANLTQQGVQLWVDNDKLGIRSPKGVFTPELRVELATHKADILAFLREQAMATTVPSNSCGQGLGLSLPTIGRLIGGFGEKLTADYKPPIIDPSAMAQKLTVTFRPLPRRYNNQTVLKFGEELELKLREHGVTIEPWHQATREFCYAVNIPLINWKQSIKMRVVKADINAVIDVERPPSLKSKLLNFLAESLYKIYCRLILKDQKISIVRIAKLIGWAEEHAAKYVENPTNTQVIMLTELDREFVNPKLPYQQKIRIGINTLVRTFSEIVIGVSKGNISILNMNLSDSIFSKEDMDQFVLKSLIPKLFVPIAPLLISRFELEKYYPQESIYAIELVKLGKKLESTGLLPPGFKISEVVKRKSHRDIVDVIINGRTGVSYGFVAYAETPQYIGEPEITEDQWESLLPVEGFSRDEVRQNEISRRYVKTKIGTEYAFKQIPDIWIVSSRSGANKTDLKLETDVLRIGLKNKLFLQLPTGIDPARVDVKPSYDIYVMLAIALSAALYVPELIRNGMPIVHFHGYPSNEWFESNEYCAGVQNPSVPCGTYESG
ncbi:MAG: hypothetical protein ACREPR_11710, partial [Brasilonema sp.]